MTTENIPKNGAGLPPPRVPFNLRLRSLKASRQTMARILREYGRGTLSEPVYKSLIWGLSGYLAFLKAGTEEEILARLDTLEKKIKDDGGQKDVTEKRYLSA